MFPDFSNLAESLRARGIDNSPTLCERALSEAGVAFLPGSKFGQDPSELVARIAFVNFDGDAALKLAVRWPQDMPLDQSFLEQACPDTLEAIHTLSQWLEG
jgi:aspartate aminotransferase